MMAEGLMAEGLMATGSGPYYRLGWRDTAHWLLACPLLLWLTRGDYVSAD